MTVAHELSSSGARSDSVDVDLPSPGSPGNRRLPHEARGYLLVRSLLELGTATAVALVLVLTVVPSDVRGIALSVLAAVAVLATLVEIPVLNRLTLVATSFTVTPDWVYVQRGILLRRTVVVPSRKILTVDTVEGPLLRKWGLVTVRFTCLTKVESLGPLTVASARELITTLTVERRS